MFDQDTIAMLLEGVVDTLYMTLVSTFFSYVFGMIMGVILVICRQDGITPRPMVYAGGDAVTGAATVILAMGAGKLGAKSIDEYLSNK